MAANKNFADKARKECIAYLFDLYPRERKLIYKSFDQLQPSLTRTQQIIVLTLSLNGMLSMSELAARISTSNEQATRAVSQLVDKGYIERKQNRYNRRVVNIQLTEQGESYVKKAKKACESAATEKFSMLSEEELQELSAAMESMSRLLDKVDPSN